MTYFGLFDKQSPMEYLHGAFLKFDRIYHFPLVLHGSQKIVHYEKSFLFHRIMKNILSNIFFSEPSL